MPMQRKEEGAVLVEFALVLGLLLLILVGMMQFGLALNAKINETQLTAMGARYAVVNQNPGVDTPLYDYIKSRGDTGDLREDSKVCIEFPNNPDTDTAGEVGDPVTVSMTFDYPLLPILGLGDITISIDGDATMRLEAIPEDIDEGCTA
jgi:hypothetical protein